MPLYSNCVSFKLINNQFISVICVNLLTISYGGLLGWLSPYLPVYLSDQAPLDSGKITIDELSWISAYVNIGCLIGNFWAGYISNSYGRKLSILSLVIPNIASLLFIIYATNVYCLYASQLFSGISGGGLYVAIPVFVAEIAQPEIRGILSLIIAIFTNVGIVIVFIMGIYLSSIVTCKILLVLSFLFIISMIFVPETPQYLLKRNQFKAAIRSLEYYRNCANIENDELLIKEFELLKLNATDFGRSEDKANFKDLFKPLALKGILIGIVLSMMNPVCGCLPLITFTSIFFERSGSDFDPNISALFVGVARLISGFVSVQFVDKFGRKQLLYMSTCGMIIGLTAMGIFSFLYNHGFNLESYQFVPLAGITFAVFAGGIGILGMPMVMIPEVLPKNILSIGVAITTASYSVFSFIIQKVVPILIFSIEVYGCMLIFIFFCTLGLLFTIFVIPETKGKNLEVN